MGVLADRWFEVPIWLSLGAAAACIAAWAILANTRARWAALLFLWASVAGFGAGYHQWVRYRIDPDDLSQFADHDGQPARLRAVVQSAPTVRTSKRDFLRSFTSPESARFVVRASERQDLATRIWRPVAGNVQVTVIGRVPDINIGDEVELLGRLALPGEAMNPGERGQDAFLRDQGITTILIVLDADEVTTIREGWPTNLFGWLAILRGWGQETLGRELSSQQDVAAALLLGEGGAMSGDAWEAYQRTGVIHVLAISGQHLVVLAGFLWFAARFFAIRRRNIALAIALLLIGYALLAGGRPPVMRAAWVVAAYCGGIVLQRPVSHANTFALAWIGVVATNPCDIFDAGCQLSFLAVAILVYGVGRWLEIADDPLRAAIDASRPWYWRVAFWVGRWIAASYLANAIVWLAVTPLVAANFHVAAPVALLIGPPMTLLTSVALLAGFGLLIFAGWFWPLAWVFGWVTQMSLAGCEWIVTSAQEIPGAYFFVSDIPAWWLWGFYLGLLLAISLPLTARQGWCALCAGVLWLAVGITVMLWPHSSNEFRCTFVAVGHGGCTVIESPSGKVIVYDAGATAGPNVTRFHIAPFLWSRGIRHIDELILSHADLDHFNGVPQLADRFSIGRVVSTPTFVGRTTPAVKKTLAALESRGIRIDVATRGMRWEVDGVQFEALHPPVKGPEGKENARSLVLRVRHGAWSMLLTGDLEEEGLVQVLAARTEKVDLLMAPHHGSDKANIPALAKWAGPKLVVSSQTAPTSRRASVAMYEKSGARFLGTWPHGAITIRPNTDVQVETFRTKLALRPF